MLAVGAGYQLSKGVQQISSRDGSIPRGQAQRTNASICSHHICPIGQSESHDQAQGQNERVQHLGGDTGGLIHWEPFLWQFIHPPSQ